MSKHARCAGLSAQCHRLPEYKVRWRELDGGRKSRRRADLCENCLYTLKVLATASDIATQRLAGVR